jgi:hypothetical protein
MSGVLKLGLGSNGLTRLLDLLGRRPMFLDATASTFCHDALRTPTVQYFCTMPFLEEIAGTVQFYFAHAQDPPDAETQTPSDPQLTFIKLSFILTERSGRNLGNEATIFHEALHALGFYDYGLGGMMSLLKIGDDAPICRITKYIEDNVLGVDGSRLKGTEVQACP